MCKKQFDCYIVWLALKQYVISEGVFVSIFLSWLSFKGGSPLHLQKEEINQEGTIGRAPDNQFVLHDPEKYVSRYHASIYEIGGNWFIKDTSSTATTVNNSVTLKKGQQFLLSESDEINIGESVILVDKIASPIPIQQPVQPPKPVHQPQPVVNVVADSAASLAFNIDDFFDDASSQNELPVGADTGPTPASLAPQASVGEELMQQPVSTSQPASAAAIDSSAELSQDTIALRSFLKELGMEPSQLIGQNKADVMRVAGVVLKTLTEGMMGVLNARSLMKEKLELDQTQIKQEMNNPFKFSSSPEEALAKMLTQEPGYLDPVSAATEAVDDSKAHQLAMISGLNIAIQQTIDSFDPKSLEEKFQIGFSLSKKAKYWDIYCSVYEKIAEDAQSDSSNIFIRHFREHYELQISKLSKYS